MSFSIYVKAPRNGKIRSIKIENLNNETTPGMSDSRFVSDHVGDHPKTDSHQNPQQEQQPYRLQCITRK